MSTTNCIASLALYVAAVTWSHAALLSKTPETPSIVSAAAAKVLVGRLPSYTRFSYSGLIFFNKRLYASSNLGLLEFENGSLKQLYQWKRGDSVVEGPWRDSANKQLWIWLPGVDELRTFDGKDWSPVSMPKPNQGYISRGDALRGYRGVSDNKMFWLQGAGRAWVWLPEAHGWNEQTNPPTFGPAPNILPALKGLAAGAERTFFVMRHELEPILDADATVRKLRGDTVHYFAGGWREVTNMTAGLYFAEQVVAADRRCFIRAKGGDVLEVSNEELTRLPSPGRCEALARTSSGKLLACFAYLGVFELNGEWRQKFKSPYPATQGNHWVHLDESEGTIAVATSPVPQLVKSGSAYKTVYYSSAALWIFDGKKLEKVSFPED